MSTQSLAMESNNEGLDGDSGFALNNEIRPTFKILGINSCETKIDSYAAQVKFRKKTACYCSSEEEEMRKWILIISLLFVALNFFMLFFLQRQLTDTSQASSIDCFA